ncbi:MAG: T9SS type A sorting domain-containing protein [Bacteroidota bacterium]
MKRQLLTISKTIFILLITLESYSQTIPLKPLYEEFTSSTCVPCAAQNQILDAILEANPETHSLIKYQMNWPGSGDPYYIEDGGIRRDYYNVAGVPILFVNASEMSPGDMTQIIYNSFLNDLTAMEIDIVTAELENDITISAEINVENNYPSGLTAYIAVVEKTTTENVGTNGETEFHNVLLKMLPDASGITLPALTPGTTHTITETYDMGLTFMEEPTDIKVIVFVQNDSDGSIIQSETTDVEFQLPTNQNDCKLVSISNVPEEFCSAIGLSPVIKVQNYGSDTITSLGISYNVNGGAPENYNWSGELAYYETEIIELPEIIFDLLDDNSLQVTVDTVNGNVDTNPDDNTLDKDFASSTNIGNLSISLHTDNYGSETSWAIINYAGEILHSGGPYTDESLLVLDMVQMELPDADCFRFEIYDSWGDGIAGNYGTGFYKLYSDGELFAEGGDFGYIDVVSFGRDIANKVGSVFYEQNLNIYPNPATDIVNIEYKSSITKVELYNYVGVLVLSKNVSSKFSEVNISNLNAGVYIFRITTLDGIIVKRIIIG